MSRQSRYTILRKIADGGTAEIFLAKQHGAQGFEKPVVLKRIFTTFYADPQFRHMLVDEAHVAMSLNHSNIVQVLDLGEAEGRYFLAMELVDGWTLDRILKRSKAAGVPLPPALALYLTAEICRALAYAHNKQRADGKPLGIVHRDVSPHNVLVSEQGEVKLTDFGIAKAQNKTEKSLGNLIKGKVAFMSPEQAAGGELDGRSDLFSAGTMLYAMITRRHPFDAPTDYETLMLVKNGDFLPPEAARPGLNPELYRVMRKAMGKTPADRYQKAEDMLVDVEQVMRLAFRPVGQTELQRWLAELGAKDGVPTLTREVPPGQLAERSTVGPLRAGDGQESGLVLELDDAEEVRSADARPRDRRRDPPPPPSASTEVMSGPPGFLIADRPWHGRPGVRLAGALAVLVIAIAIAGALRHRRPPPAAPAVAAAPGGVRTSPSPSVVPLPPKPPAPPAPPPTAPSPAIPPATPPASARAEPAPPATGEAGEAHRPEAIAPKETRAPASASASNGEAEDTTPPPPRRKVTPPPSADEGDEQAPTARPLGTAPPGTPKAPKPIAAKPDPFPVVIASDPPGSVVATGKHVFGATPLTLKLRPGNSYDFTFTKTGYAPLARRYRFDAHAPQTLRVDLKKLPEVRKPPATAARPTKPATAPGKGFFAR